MERPSISINIVTWNSLKYLRNCLEAIAQQRVSGLHTLIIDNDSRDGTVPWLRVHFPNIPVLQNRSNTGFAYAHNQGIRISQAKYILTLNPDVILSPDFLTKLLPAIESDERLGSATGKVLRFSLIDQELNEVKISDRFDNTGLKVLRSRRVFDQGEGEIDKGQYDFPAEVFGACGSAVLFRRAALEDVRMGDDYFDVDFFSYKEDVDLAWRLQRRGWRCLYFPEALAYHHRSASGCPDNDRVMIQQRRAHSSYINRLSYRNHLYLLIKNEGLATLLFDLPWIFSYELKKFVYLLLFDMRTLGGLFELFSKLFTMLRKRRIIRNREVIPCSTIRKRYFI